MEFCRRLLSLAAKGSSALSFLSLSLSFSLSLSLFSLSLFSLLSLPSLTTLFGKNNLKKVNIKKLVFSSFLPFFSPIACTQRAMGNCLSGGEGSVKKSRPASVSLAAAGVSSGDGNRPTRNKKGDC